MHKAASIPEEQQPSSFDIRYGNLRTASDLGTLLAWRAGAYRLLYVLGRATLAFPRERFFLNATELGPSWAVAFDRTDVGPLFHQSLNLLISHESRQLSVDVPANERCHWEDRFRYLLSIGDREAEHAAMHAVLKSCVSDFLRLLRQGIQLPNSDFDTVQSVLSYIERHYQEPITLRDVAEATNFSPAYLTDLVRRRTSLPIHRWIVHYRLAAAKRLLEDTGMPVSAIAAEVGFGDSSHFCRQFNRVTGLTPGVWRRDRQRRRKVAAPPAGALQLLDWFGDTSHLQAVVDAIPQMVWAKTEAGALLYANRRWYDYTGLSAEESRGHGWLAAVHPDELNRCLASWTAARAMNADLRYQARLKRAADASYRWHLIHTIACRNDCGKVRWFGTATDIHDQPATNSRARVGVRSTLH